MDAMGDKESRDSGTRCPVVNAATVAKFLCLFVVVYGILVSPWPGFDRAYAMFYREALVFLSGSLAGNGSVRLERSVEPEYDIRIVFYDSSQLGPDGEATGIGFFGQNSRQDAYVFVAFAVALVLATPLPWKRKTWAMVWTIAAVHLFISFKLGIWILYGLTKDPFRLFAGRRFLIGAVSVTKEVCVRNINFGLILCVLIWVVASFHGAIRRSLGAGAE